MVTVGLPKVPLYSTASLSSRMSNVILFLNEFPKSSCNSFYLTAMVEFITTTTTAKIITIMTMMMMMKQLQHVLGCLRQSVMCFFPLLEVLAPVPGLSSTRSYVHEENRDNCVIAWSHVGADRAFPLHRTGLYQKSSRGIFWTYFWGRDCWNK